MILYKYRKIDNFTLNLLAKQELHFSFPSEFNDPFDSILETEAVGTEADWLKAIRMCSSNPEEIFSKLKAVNFDKKFQPDMSKLYRRTMRVYSLSEINDSILMWSHYGDYHKGICLGFELKKEKDNLAKLLCEPDKLDLQYFGKHDEGYFVDAENVNYSLQLPSPLNPLKTNDKTEINKLGAFLTTKHPDWRYEKEWRICIHSHLMNSDKLYFKKNALKSVTFGINTEKNQKKLVRDLVKEHYINCGYPVPFFVAKQIKGTYSLQVVED